MREKEEEEWEAYDASKMEIRLTPWVANIIESYSSLPDYSDKKCERVKISREMKMSDFKTYVEQLF